MFHPDCNQSQTATCHNRVFDNNVTLSGQGNMSIKTAGFLNLERYLPNKDSKFSPNSIVISTTISNTGGPFKIRIDFKLNSSRPRNTEVKCVFWSNKTHEWSEEGCKFDKGTCECNHLSAFAILMSKAPLKVPYLNEVTYAGLSVSIVSLIICLAVELILWRDVVKTDTLHLRHCAHVNISICLLVADVCFLASQLPDELSELWCKTFVVVEHFCFLAMFFWIKTAYLRYSVIVGYICPLLIVVITFLANNAGKEGQYYSKDTRWLVYSGTFKGSIFTFILPVGIIVFVNVFFMCLVIMKLLQPMKVAERVTIKEKNSAKMVIRSVILLTPVFGLTWGFGFLVMIVDLTDGPLAFAVHYIFTIMNAFQVRNDPRVFNSVSISHQSSQIIKGTIQS
uniref:G-protein coupled receptors family 2 profile 2 domain-containing protein n=1 Tax=Neogobius melanostomus TaxID=47308 RepID=A0A8C6SLX6_9GOBI